MNWIDVTKELPKYTKETYGNKITDNVLVWNGEDIYKANLEAVRPDFNTLVWSFAENIGCDMCGTSYDSFDEIESYSGKAVTHWMPLPNKPDIK